MDVVNADLKHVIHHKLNPLGTPKTHVPKAAELKHVIQHSLKAAARS